MWRRWRPSPCYNTCTARTAPEQFCCSYQIILKLRCPGQPIGARMKPERSGSPVLAHVTMFVQFFLLISDDWQNFDFPWLSTFFFQKSKLSCYANWGNGTSTRWLPKSLAQPRSYRNSLSFTTYLPVVLWLPRARRPNLQVGRAQNPATPLSLDSYG